MSSRTSLWRCFGIAPERLEDGRGHGLRDAAPRKGAGRAGEADRALTGPFELLKGSRPTMKAEEVDAEGVDVAAPVHLAARSWPRAPCSRSSPGWQARRPVVEEGEEGRIAGLLDPDGLDAIARTA